MNLFTNNFSRGLFIFLTVLVSSCNRYKNESHPVQNDLVDLANPLMGTASTFSLSNGNTYPAVATPWGMNFWTPMTAKMNDGWTYNYNHHKIRGIKQTHQPSPWLNDYAAFSLMATVENEQVDEENRASWFSHKAEKTTPYYYKVYLADYDVTAEVTPTERTAHFRFTFPKTQDAKILIDAFDKGSMVKIIPEKRQVVGYCRNHHGGVPANFHNYFVIQFDTDFKAFDTWKDGWKIQKNTAKNSGNHVGAVLRFKTKTGQKIGAKVASSFISLAQARLNLSREIGTDSFATTLSKAKNTWEKEFSKIQVQGSNTDDIKTFYSCLYRLLLFPRKFYEYDAQENPIHYSPYNGQILSGYLFTDNGFWDTFRAVFPFFNLMYPELTAQIMEGLANTYKESGWLPEWASPGHRNVMIGSNSASIIADAFLKGNADKHAQTLWEALLKNANVEKGRPENSVGREGLEFYNKLGYVPYDVAINENAARTLEYAYDDFALAKMADKLKKPTLAKRFYKQARNYIHLFDKETGWMRGKNKNGTFQKPFQPLKWGDAFTEGNSLHYTWSVFHDIQGLIDLMGGNEKFIQKLDTVFTMPPRFDDSYYGFTIHEIREMQIVGMGNYAHGNQPIQHMLYLYNYAGASYKTQKRVREVMRKLYQPTPDGYCGDEDNGQTSAWYVFSALGFYPVTPVSDQYVLGSPLFSKAKLHLPNGNTFEIDANNNSEKNVYIKNTFLRGNVYQKTYLKFDDILKGGLFRLEMDSISHKKRGVDLQPPYSLSNEN